MSWTEERIERLKSMWTEGATASQIAEELGGVSRNAVIGKAHRLGLESRPSPVKPGEEKEKKAKAAPAPKAAKPAPAAPKAAAPAPQPKEPSPEASRRPVSAGTAPQPKPGETTIQYRSVGPGGFIRQGPGDTQAPIPPAPPRRLVPAKPSRRGRRQDVAARSERPRLPLADGPSGRARLPLLRQSGEPRLSLLRRSLRRRLPGAAAPPRPPPPAAPALRRPARPIKTSPGRTRDRGFSLPSIEAKVPLAEAGLCFSNQQLISARS